MYIPSAKACFLLGSGFLLLGAPRLPAGSSAYFTLCCNVPSTVSVLNSHTLAEDRSFPVGLRGNNIALSPDGSIAYVTNDESETVSVVKTATGQAVATIQLPISTNRSQLLIVVSTDGRHAYVSAPFQTPSSTVYAIDTATDQVTGSVALGTTISPGNLVLSPNNEKLYVAAGSPTYLQVIDVATLGLGKQIPINQNATGLAVTVSNLVLVTDANNELVVIDPGAGAITNRFTAPGGTFDQLGAVAASRNGSVAYIVSTIKGPSILALNIADGSTAFQVNLAALPLMLALSPVGPRLFTTNANASVSLIDLTSHILIQTTNRPGAVASLAVAPNGQSAYVVNASNSAFATVNVTSGKVTGVFPSGTGLGSVAVGPSGTAWVSDPSFGSLSSVLSEIDPITGDFIVNVPAPGGVLLFSPDGSKLFISTPSRVYALDSKTLKQLGSIPYGGLENSGPILISPDGKTLYDSVGFVSGKTVFPPGYISVVDTSTYKKIAAISLPDGAGAVALTPDGSELLSTANNGHVHVISTTTNKIATTIQVTPANDLLGGIAVTADGSKAYVTDAQNGLLIELDLTTDTQVGSFALSNGPGQIAITPDGTEAYVFRVKNVAVVNLSSHRVTGTLPLPYRATAVAFH